MKKQKRIQEKKVTKGRKEKTFWKEKKSGNGVGIHGIQFKLFAIFLIPVIGIISLGIISYKQASSVVIDNSKAATQQTMSMLSEYYQAQFDAIQSQVDVFYMNADVKEYMSGQYELSSTLSVQFHNSFMDDVKHRVWGDDKLAGMEFIASGAKSVFTAIGFSNDEAYTQLVETTLYQKLVENENEYVWFGRNTQLDEILGTKQEDYLFRVGIQFNNGAGVGFAEVTEKTLSSVMEGLNFGENSVVGILTADGTELAYNGTDFNTTGGVFEGYLSDAKNGNADEYVDYNGESYLFLHAPVVEGQVDVCVLIPESYFLDQTVVIRNIAILVAIVAAVIVIIIGNIFAGSLGKSIRSINKTLGKIAAGDLTVRMNLKRKDEFKLLADSVNNMADNVCGLVREVSQAGTVLLDDAQEVATVSNKFVESADIINNSLEEIEIGVEQLNSSSENSLSQMQLLASQFKLVNQNASRISDATNHTNTAIANGLETMQNLKEKTDESTQMMTKVSETMDSLQGRINHIGMIVNAIDDIAEQTTLLSLNASIEAARAGESGRGFAVVADEIRKLADQSLISAGEIRKIIEEITHQTKEASESVGNASASVDEQSRVVDSTTKSFHEMNEQTRILTAQVQEILVYIQNMESARVTTEDAMQGISAVAEETEAGAVNVHKSTGEQAEEALKLQRATEQLNEWAEKLKTAISQFSVE
ncbi:MAG: methyl-accepting chemotaxis protein [Lachnospiraceae bacterium]|nr:methyl-accepting chemotaxis protein [Lachnospiraceae bacterium]